MSHIVEFCLLKKLNGGLSRVHSADEDAVSHMTDSVVIIVMMQVELATRLSDTSTQLADSQLEVTSLKNRKSELRQQLDKLVTMDTQARDELSSLKLQLTGQFADICYIILH